MMSCRPDIIASLRQLLARYDLRVELVSDTEAVPGSYWGEPEAGLIENVLYVRADTPLHSALHEAAHFVCMDKTRRSSLHTNAGGDYEEENGVCYLQILWAQQLGVSVEAFCADMDAWGYTFRLGAAHAWYLHDAEDARVWLLQHGVIDSGNLPTFRCRN